MQQFDISQVLKELLEYYSFNEETLAKYLSLDMKHIQEILRGNFEALPYNNIQKFEIYNKIMFLSLIPKDSKDLRLSSFLEVLISYHKLSTKTIAKMAEVKISDIDNILKNSEDVPIDIKYKVAITVMSLRFFLKENELIAPNKSKVLIRCYYH